MMGAWQQSTGNSYLLPWEAGKNVWIVTGSDSDDMKRLQSNEVMVVVNNKYMYVFFYLLECAWKGINVFFQITTYDRWGRKSNLNHRTSIILIHLSAVFCIYYLCFLLCSVCRMITTVSVFLFIGLLNESDEMTIFPSPNIFIMPYRWVWFINISFGLQ
jgi:hypothetical protein